MGKETFLKRFVSVLMISIRKMAGKPFKVGRFSHSLRVRLMREHIGIDVDALDNEDVRAHGSTERRPETGVWDPDNEEIHGREFVTEKGPHHHTEKLKNVMRSAADVIRPGDVSNTVCRSLSHSESAVVHETEGLGSKEIVRGLNKEGLDSEPDLRAANATVEERNSRARDDREAPSFADSLAPTLEEKILAKHRFPDQNEHGMSDEKNPAGGASELGRSVPAKARADSGQLSGAPTGASFAPGTDTQPPQPARAGKRDSDAEAPRARPLRKQLSSRPGQSPWTILTPKPKFDADSFEDPVSDKFWKDIWVACAVHNVSRLRVSRKVVAKHPAAALDRDLPPCFPCYSRRPRDDLEALQGVHRAPRAFAQASTHVLPSLKCPSHEPIFQLRDDVAPEPIARAPSSAIKERSSDEQEPRSEETSTAPSLLTVKDETQSHLPNGSLRGHHLKHEKSLGERLDGTHAGEKAGGSVHTEKANGSATTDKSKKAKGELPFTKQEREEMETLLQELCGHLGQYFLGFSAVLHAQLRLPPPVIYPTRFLEGEDVAKNFLFNTDRLLPLPIYN
jgi:phospholipase D1/2